jgi:acyl-CoA dehydrogenase
MLEAPFDGMAEAGLFRVGLPAPWGDDSGYAAIAETEASLVAATGLPGLAMAWAGRQLVGRFFLAGFGTEAQRAHWLPLLATGSVATSVAISEPGVGAHPKALTTRAERDGDGWRLTGEKAWVTNGPIAGLYVVLAITAVEDGRKRYSAFLVPRETPGLGIKDMPSMHGVLRPSGHCGLVLDGVRVGPGALLGPEGRAYEAMALPFRDVEDIVGASGLAGALRWLVRRVGAGAPDGDEAAAWIGGLAARVAVLADASAAAVARLEAGRARDAAPGLAGTRVLAQDLLALVESGPYRAPADSAMDRLVADLEALLNVARGPRLARQASLGRTWMGRTGA